MNVFVPIHIEALRVSQADREKSFAGPTADFSQNNINNPENVIRPLWEDAGASITKSHGIHLHWALPDAYTRAVQTSEGKLSFPGVPNRWLLVRHFFENKREDSNIKLIDFGFTV